MAKKENLIITKEEPKIIALNGKELVSETSSKLDMDREIANGKAYNLSVLNGADKTANYIINGNQVMVRLFKHIPYDFKNGGTIYNPLQIRVQTEGGKYKTEVAPLQFIRRGVIYNISGGCSENFKQNFKVGTVIDLRLGIALEQKHCFLEPEDLYFGDIESSLGYFIVNENDIEKGIASFDNVYAA